MLPVTGQLVSLTPLPPPMVPDVHLVNPPQQPLQPSFCYLRFLSGGVEKRPLTGRSWGGKSKNLFTTNISLFNPNLVTCLEYSPLCTTCSSLCVSLSGPPSQSAPIIPIHPLPWHYAAIYHLSPLRCPPSHYLPHRFHFLVIVFLSSAALVLLLRSLACCALFSTRWVNKTAWFHQCESVSLTRRDPDESIFSYAAIHHDRIRAHSRWCPSACV